MELRDYFRPEAELLEDVAGAIKVLYLSSRSHENITKLIL